MVDDGAQGPFSQFGADLTASTFTLDVTGLTVSRNYRFKVLTTNDIGTSESNIVSSIVSNVPQTPTTAPGFMQSETNTTSIRVVVQETQNGGDAVTSYHLQRTQHGGSVFFDVAGSPQNQTTYTQFQVAGLSKGLAYRFRYRAVNQVGFSEWSPESLLTPATVPAAPP